MRRSANFGTRVAVHFDFDKMADEVFNSPPPPQQNERITYLRNILRNSAVREKWNTRRFSELGELLDERLDPDVVFRNNWLAKGQAFGLVAGSGIGKSSLTVQLAYHWAFGQMMLADPMHNLKIAIIQAEDSDRDLKEQRDGMIRGLTEIEGWSVEDIAEADKNIVVPNDFIGKSGPDFINLLRDFQGDTHQDLLFINPLQSFFGGDVSSQEDAYEFANGIDSIIKHKDLKCTSGIVMHTPKWKSGHKDGRQDVSDFAEYMMAGSHAWTDWLRAIFAFQKHGDSELYFDLKAAKRGKRLGWTDAEGNLTTTKLFKHSEGFIYWQEVTDAAEIADIPEPEPTRRGAKPKARLDIEKSAITASTEYTETLVGSPRQKVIQALWENDRREHPKSEWALVVDRIMKEPEKFGFQVLEVKESNGKYYPRMFLASNKK